VVLVLALFPLVYFEGFLATTFVQQITIFNVSFYISVSYVFLVQELIQSGLDRGFHNRPSDTELDWATFGRKLAKGIIKTILWAAALCILYIATSFIIQLLRDPPNRLLGLGLMILLLHGLVYIFVRYRKLTGHKPMDSYAEYGGISPDEFRRLKRIERIAHMEDVISARV
jgi:hypothetical protein